LCFMKAGNFYLKYLPHFCHGTVINEEYHAFLSCGMVPHPLPSLMLDRHKEKKDKEKKEEVAIVPVVPDEGKGNARGSFNHKDR